MLFPRNSNRLIVSSDSLSEGKTRFWRYTLLVEYSRQRWDLISRFYAFKKHDLRYSSSTDHRPSLKKWLFKSWLSLLNSNEPCLLISAVHVFI